MVKQSVLEFCSVTVFELYNSDKVVEDGHIEALYPLLLNHSATITPTPQPFCQNNPYPCGVKYLEVHQMRNVLIP